jgi:hypothetical protein
LDAAVIGVDGTPRKRETSVAVFAALAIVCGAFATPAVAYNKDHVVGPQWGPAWINGISIGDTNRQVHRSTPFDLNEPTSSVVSEAPIGKIRTETYLSGEGDTLLVEYSVPKNKKHKKRKHPRVLAVSTGSGFWIIAETDVQYDTTTGYASPRSELASFWPSCKFYEFDASGQRDYNPDPGDGQYCEVRYPDRSGFFYFTLNEGGFSANVEAQLAGFTLSKYQIP